MTLSNERCSEFTTPPIESTDVLLDAWREALAEALAREQRHWEAQRTEERVCWAQERALHEAQTAKIIADLQREIVETREATRVQMAAWQVNLELRVTERLALLQNGEPGPAGLKGERGERGLQGLAGDVGLQGPRGETGYGIEGKEGPRGEAGLVGAKGEKGDPGEGKVGAPGPAGKDGLSIIGPEGRPGRAGERGPQGLRGLPGESGRDGRDGERGERGLDGAPGAKGERGEKGEQGPPGERGEGGAPGQRGEKGESGTNGVDGQPGTSGRDGAAGSIGERGPAGDAGPQGERGAQGAPGKLPIVKAWAPDTVFYEGDVVVHQGSSWQARRDTGQAPPHADWIGIAFRGIDGTSPQVRGTWDEKASYKALDIVASNGGSFIARRDGPGALPGDGWQLIVRQGRPGDKGERGEKGERGGRGEAGAPGAAAPILRSWMIDRAGFVAVPLMSDGTRGPALELRGLFEQFQIEIE